MRCRVAGCTSGHRGKELVREGQRRGGGPEGPQPSSRPVSLPLLNGPGIFQPLS